MSNTAYSAEHRTEGQLDIPAAPTLELSLEEKVEYLYQVVVKVEALVAAITPAQVEQVQKLQRNPFLAKMFSGIIPGSD